MADLDQQRKHIKDFSDSLRVSLSYADGGTGPIVIDGKSYIAIPSEDYIEVAPGVFDRRVLHKDDIKFEHEESFRELLEKMDFESKHVLFVRFGFGSIFQPHYHLTDEEIYLINGSYESNGNIYKPGSFHYIPANQIHNWNTIEGGLALLTLKKEE